MDTNGDNKLGSSSPDRLVERVFRVLGKDYVIMNGINLKGWQLYLVIGLFAGFLSGIVFVANQKGKFGKTKAQPPAVVEPQATGENVPIYYTYSISENAASPFMDQNTHPFVSGTMVNVKWRQVHEAPGIFNWSRLDAIIRDWTGGATSDADTPRKIFLKIVPYGASPIHDEDEGEARADLTECVNDITPEWVYESVLKIKFLGGVCKKLGLETVVPKVWDAAFYPIYEEFIRALGERYNNDKRVAGFQIGIGIIGTINTAGSKEAATVFRASPHNWTLPVWEKHSYKIIDMSKRHLIKPLILRTAGGFLDPFPIDKEPGLGTAKRILKYATEKDIAILLSGLAPEDRQFKKSAIPELVSYLGSLNLSPERFRIGFTDDWPLWEPNIRKKGKRCPDAPRCNRTANGFAQELQHAFDAWNGINKKYPIFFFFLDNELVASNPETPEQCGAETRYGCFHQPVYDVIAQYFTPFLPQIPPVTNIQMTPIPLAPGFNVKWQLQPFPDYPFKGYTIEVGKNCQAWNGEGEPQCEWIPNFWFDYPPTANPMLALLSLPNELDDKNPSDGPSLEYGKTYCVDIYAYRSGQDTGDDVYACGTLTNPAPPFTGTVTPLASSIVAVSWKTETPARASVEYKTTPFTSQTKEGTFFPSSPLSLEAPYTTEPAQQQDLCPTGLTPNTQYYARVWNKDAQGKETASAQFIFKTPPTPQLVFQFSKDHFGLSLSEAWRKLDAEKKRGAVDQPYIRTLEILQQWDETQPAQGQFVWSFQDDKGNVGLDDQLSELKKQEWAGGRLGVSKFLRLVIRAGGAEGGKRMPEWAAEGVENLAGDNQDDKVVRWDPQYTCRYWRLVYEGGKRYDKEPAIRNVAVQAVSKTGEMGMKPNYQDGLRALGYQNGDIARNMKWLYRNSLKVYAESFPHKSFRMNMDKIPLQDPDTQQLAHYAILDELARDYGNRLTFGTTGPGADRFDLLKKYRDKVVVSIFSEVPNKQTSDDPMGDLRKFFENKKDGVWLHASASPGLGSVGLHDDALGIVAKRWGDLPELKVFLHSVEQRFAEIRSRP